MDAAGEANARRVGETAARGLQASSSEERADQKPSACKVERAAGLKARGLEDSTGADRRDLWQAEPDGSAAGFLFFDRSWPSRC